MRALTLLLLLTACSGRLESTQDAPESICQVHGGVECGDAVPVVCEAPSGSNEAAQSLGLTGEVDCWESIGDGVHWCCIGKSVNVGSR
jgi:hypothetical protein